MKDTNYPLHLIHLLAELYRKQNATVKVAGTFSEKFHIQKGIRQGCVMSPYLFNIMAEMLIWETLDDLMGGIQIDSQEITNLRYADDIVLIAQSANKLQELVTRLDTVDRNKYGLHINTDKTKFGPQVERHVASQYKTCSWKKSTHSHILVLSSQKTRQTEDT